MRNKSRTFMRLIHTDYKKLFAYLGITLVVLALLPVSYASEDVAPELDATDEPLSEGNEPNAFLTEPISKPP